MGDQNMEDIDMTDDGGAPVNNPSTNTSANRTVELTIRPGNPATLVNTPPPAPTQSSFPIFSSATSRQGSNAHTNNSQAGALTTTAAASASASNPAAPATATASRTRTAHPPSGGRASTNTPPWHTWGRLAEIMRSHADEPQRGLRDIRKRSVPVMRARRRVVGKRAIRTKQSDLWRHHRLRSATQLGPALRKQLRDDAVAGDAVYRRLTQVMGRPTSKGHTVPVKHVEDQLLRLARGDQVTYRCCRCGRAGRQRQSVKGKEVEGRGGAKCQCGHLLCMLCLHVETEEDELIDFEFMALGDDGDDDEEEGGGDDGGMGGAGVAMEVGA